jgi:hypothetical protein
LQAVLGRIDLGLDGVTERLVNVEKKMWVKENESRVAGWMKGDL